jgi:CRISPR-associated protein Cas2
MEVRPGTFLGNPSLRVRDKLWQKLTERPPLGYVCQIWSSRHPQGFEYRQHGTSKRRLEDFEGLALVTITKSTRKNRKAGKIDKTGE